MPGTLEQINQYQSRLRGRIDAVSKELKRWKHKHKGKVVGLNLPQDIRDRIDKQCSVWGAMTTKQMVGACIALGLKEMEELGRVRVDMKKAPVQKPKPPPSAMSPIQRFIQESRNGFAKDFMEEVPGLSRSSDTGDD